MNNCLKACLILLSFVWISELVFSPTIISASHSLKIALIFEIPDHAKSRDFSNKFLETVKKLSDFNLVPVDTTLSNSPEPARIDSNTFRRFHQQNFQGIVYLKIAREKKQSSLFISAIKIDRLTFNKSTELTFHEDNLPKAIEPIVEKIVDYFKSIKTSAGDIRVLVVPIKIPANDSLFLAQRRTLLDSLQNLFASPLLSSIQFKILPEAATSNKHEHSIRDEDALKNIGKDHHAQVVISGTIDSDSSRIVFFHPFIMLLDRSQPKIPIHSDIKSLEGKTFPLRQFYLPPARTTDLRSFADFLTAYFLLLQKKYSDAISLFKSNSSLPGYFYLGESFLNRGITKEEDVPGARTDWDSSVVYLKKCLPEASAPSDSVCVHNNLGVAFQFQGKIDSAIVYFAKANYRLAAVSDYHDRIRVSNNLGNIYLLNGKWKQALDVFQASLEDVEQSSDSLLKADTYENLGNIYQLIMQRNKAISYYNRALDIRKTINDEAGMADCFHLLGNVYAGKTELETAKNYFRQSLALNLKLQNEPRIADSYDLIGQVFQDLNEPDSALIYYQKSMETYDILGDEVSFVRTLLHQASVHQKQKNFDKALTLYQQALQFAEKKNSKSIRAQIYDRLGDIYNNQNDLKSAYDYYKQSADLYEQNANYESLALILFNMGLIRLKQNDYAEGYDLLKRAVSLDEEHGFNNLSGEQDFLRELELIISRD